jgi:ABC-type transporter Mla subunit MlaD
MTASVDGVLERATEAVERTRQGIIAQGEAIDTMIDRAQTASDAAASHAAEALSKQDGLGAAMIERIQRGLAHVEARFAELDETGRARTERLGDALGQLGGHVERVMASLNDGGTAATTFINRAETLRGAIGACLAELNESLPTALAELESQATRSRELIASAGPEAERLHAVAKDASDALDAARTALEERRAAIDELADAIDIRLAAAREGTTALGETIGQVDTEAAKLADSTSPKLVDALIRVRETATQAAERAREALGTIIPRSAEALGDAGRAALEKAVGEQVEGQIARVSAASEAAIEAARAAGSRLEEQLARIAETSASVDGQIAEGKETVESYDRDNFSRRVALLIDSLNSTAIDVTKLLSNEPSDSAWASYLRGDRGVFTRRAVRLIEGGEAREIAKHYEDEPEFREQVNRYVHDFETLLRPILSTREGSTLAVILLSSDMGKLYVALAQAIERLRA